MKQADEQREAMTVKLGPLLNELGLRYWQSGRGKDHASIEDAFEAVIVAALAAALPPAAVQAGWKLVPIEPTDAMYQAAEQNATRVAVAAQRRGSNDTEPGYCSTYRAMLAAVAEGTLPTDQAIYEQRFRTVLDVVQRYLPPGGIDAKTAMGEITALVDPWPGTVAGGVATVTPEWRQAFERAMKQTYGAVDPFKPAGQPGSYWRGEHNGIVGALQTLRENFERELTRGVGLGPQLYECAECSQPDCNWRGECDGESCPTCGGHVVPVPAGVAAVAPAVTDAMVSAARDALMQHEESVYLNDDAMRRALTAALGVGGDAK